MVKPFDPRELVARIRSLLRSVAGGNGAAGDTVDADEIRFNDWRLNRVTRPLTNPASMPFQPTPTLLNVGNQCKPVANARVDIWHCDKDGVYSGYSPPGANTVG